MNIYITSENEEWLRIQNSSMSGIINRLLDEARAGKHGPHVLASYKTREEAWEGDAVRPDSVIGLTTGDDVIPLTVAKVIKSPKQTKEPILKVCKHGAAPGFCKHFGCVNYH